MNTIQQINALVGNTDLYLLDFILKDKFLPGSTLLDAGCGEGRNLKYFAENGFEVYGIDKEPLAIKMARMTFRQVPAGRFVAGDTTELPFDAETFDIILSSAVLHFASSHGNFMQQWRELTRVARSGGLLFLRMASLWGGVRPADFSYYLTDDLLREMMKTGWELTEPIKTVLVENQRSMSVLLLKRR